MFGVGPGQLTSDAMMLGIDPHAAAAADGGGVRRHDAAVPRARPSPRRPSGSRATRRCCRCGRTATSTSRSRRRSRRRAPSSAGRYGVGLLSIAATDPMAFQVLADNWQRVAASEAAEQRPLRRRGRSGGSWARCTSPTPTSRPRRTAATACSGSSTTSATSSPSAPSPLPPDYDELVDLLNESGRGVIGTPEMAIAQIERLQERSGLRRYLFLRLPTSPTGEPPAATTSCSPRRSCPTSPGSSTRSRPPTT